MTRTDTPRARWKWLAIGLSLAVAVFLVAVSACGGSSESTPTPKSSGSSGGQATNAANPTETTSSSDNSGSSGGDIAQKLKDLGSKAAQVSGKVAYDMSSTDDKGVTTGGQMTLYSKPPKTRTDFSTTENGTTTNAILISTPDKDYTCTTAAGANMCLSSPPSSNNPLAAGFLGIFSNPDAIKAEVDKLGSGAKIETSSKTIAGVSANCFSASGDLGDGQTGQGEFCFADNGLLLSVTFSSTKDSSKFSLVASQAGSASDSDFDPPYPVTEMPSGQ